MRRKVLLLSPREIVTHPQQPAALEFHQELPTRSSALANHYLGASGTLNLQTQRGGRHTFAALQSIAPQGAADFSRVVPVS